ncbi:MAG: hypothetical protein RLZZ502_1277, partial [Pseudomonadota bacterium]
RDVLGLAQENIHATDTAELLQSLRARGEVWDRELAENKAFHLALNHVMLDKKQVHALQAGDEVAFLPPVTGG